MVTPTPAELVHAAAATYTLDAVPAFQSSEHAVRVFASPPRPDGVVIVACEGTKNLPGWMLDFFAFDSRDPVARMFCTIETSDHPVVNHPQLGLVHAGFDAGAMAAMPTVWDLALKYQIALAGHSLGAALARRIGAELVLRGRPALVVAAFAPPRVGGTDFERIACQVPNPAWRWGNDPVPEVPFTLPSPYHYEQVALTQTGKIDLIDPFACHDINNYVTVVAG